MAVGARGKQVLGIAAGVVLVAGSAFVLQRPQNTEPLALTLPTPTVTVAATRTATPAPVVVFVSGEVVSPGVYTLPPDSRIVDALAAAGGLTDDADPNALNQATPLKDGMQIYAPSVGVAPTPLPIVESGARDVVANGTINLNTATLEQLETLTGIGPTKAEAIVAYREAQGPFTSVEQLLDVPGIGEATLEGLQDEVTVE